MRLGYFLGLCPVLDMYKLPTSWPGLFRNRAIGRPVIEKTMDVSPAVACNIERKRLDGHPHINLRESVKMKEELKDVLHSVRKGLMNFVFGYLLFMYFSLSVLLGWKVDEE